jgi:hypothetical protein
MPLHVTRTATILKPDQSRVLLRSFSPGDAQRASRIIARIISLPEEQAGCLLEEIYDDFSRRHQQIRHRFLERYEQVRGELPSAQKPDEDLSEQRRQLIGSYFLAEYSLESAALFNPSIVRHPDQTGLQAGALCFILSLRATGEGHISSITFRTGVIHPDRRIEVLAPTGFLTEPDHVPNTQYDKALFARRLTEVGLVRDFTRRVMNRLGDSFTQEELRAGLEAEESRLQEGIVVEDQQEAQGIWTLVRSNYKVRFRQDQLLSERILFPATPSQRNGIEDARFVCFQNEDGTHVYYATFTAFDGKVVIPELVETSDCLLFISSLSTVRPPRTRVWRCFPGKSMVVTPCSPARTTKTFT